MPAKHYKPKKKPWGSYLILEKHSSYWLKKLFVNKGEQLSLQSHKHRDEIWVVLKGKIRAQKGNTFSSLQEGQYLKINKGQKHRIYGSTKAIVLEVAFGQPREGDIIRYEDKYGRVK